MSSEELNKEALCHMQATMFPIAIWHLNKSVTTVGTCHYVLESRDNTNIQWLRGMGHFNFSMLPQIKGQKSCICMICWWWLTVIQILIQDHTIDWKLSIWLEAFKYKYFLQSKTANFYQSFVLFILFFLFCFWTGNMIEQKWDQQAWYGGIAGITTDSTSSPKGLQML